MLRELSGAVRLREILFPVAPESDDKYRFVPSVLTTAVLAVPDFWSENRQSFEAELTNVNLDIENAEPPIASPVEFRVMAVEPPTDHVAVPSEPKR
jgi:hypothetical protein